MTHFKEKWRSCVPSKYLFTQYAPRNIEDDSQEAVRKFAALYEALEFITDFTKGCYWFPF
jgi:hypothetical protein